MNPTFSYLVASTHLYREVSYMLYHLDSPPFSQVNAVPNGPWHWNSSSERCHGSRYLRTSSPTAPPSVAGHRQGLNFFLILLSWWWTTCINMWFSHWEICGNPLLGESKICFFGGRCSLSKCQIQAMKGFEAADFNWDLKCAECICKKNRQELGFHQQEGNSYQEATRWSLIHKYTRWGGMFYHHECNGITRKKSGFREANIGFSCENSEIVLNHIESILNVGRNLGIYPLKERGDAPRSRIWMTYGMVTSPAKARRTIFGFDSFILFS